MAINSSSSNDSLLHPDLPPIINCLITRPISFSFVAFTIFSTLLLLPLCILVLYLGLQRWRQQRSTFAAAMTSHSDSFTYHMVAMELIGVLGDTSFFCGLYIWVHVSLLYAGYFLWFLTWYGQTSFHILTCVDRYLAVVHPITYLSLRRERGIRIRNISIGCTWVLCVGATALDSVIADFCISGLSLIVVAFCSLSVLCVLIRPGPGKQGGDRQRVDQSKRRAFNTIMTILGALLLRCFVSLVWSVVHELGESECVMTAVEMWLNLPSSLVLPLLFLHRAGRLAFCKNST